MRNIIFLEGTPAELQDRFKKLGPGINFTTPYPEETNTDSIIKDLERTCFIDPIANEEAFLTHWKDAAKTKEAYAYVQGDMVGTALPAFIQMLYVINIESDSTSEAAVKDMKSKEALELCFFENNAKPTACGFRLAYFTDKPNQWIASFLHNASAPHEQRRCQLFLYGIDQDIDLEISTQQNNRCTLRQFLYATDSYAISDLLHYCIQADNTLNLDFINHCQTKMKTSGVIKPAEIIASYHKLKPAGLLEKYSEEAAENAQQALRNSTFHGDEAYSKNLAIHYESVREYALENNPVSESTTRRGPGCTIC